MNAAGEWLHGEPEFSGRFLVEYRQYGQENVFIADYDAVNGRWQNTLNDTEIIRYAKINSDKVKYNE